MRLTRLTTMTALLLACQLTRAEGVADLGWMAGAWQGHNGQDAIQDVYLPERNGELVSVFTATAHGAPTRYEMRTFRMENGNLVLHEVAYGPGFSPVPPVPDRTVTAIDASRVEYVEAGEKPTGNYRETSVVHGPGDKMVVTLRIYAGGKLDRTIHMEMTRLKNFVAR